MNIQPTAAEKECLSLLGGMATGSGNGWNKGKAEVYTYILRDLGEEASRRAVLWAIKNCEWRPEPAKLREIAANLYSPLPAAGELWREVWHKAIAQGYDNPRWTHPVISDLVAAIGGWRYLRANCWNDTEPRFRDGLQSRFEKAYQTRAESWWQSVADQLALSPAERDAHYFPARYAAFLPPALLPPDAETGSVELSFESVEQLRLLGVERIGKGANR